MRPGCEPLDFPHESLADAAALISRPDREQPDDADTSHAPEADRTTGVIYASSSDLLFVRDVTSRELGRMGLRIGKGAEVKGYLIRVMVQALGTEQGTVLFGLPALQSILLPVALPEVALYKNQHQRALVRLSLDIYDLGTGRFVHSTPWYEASAFYNEYTVLIIFTFKSTDLQPPP